MDPKRRYDAGDERRELKAVRGRERSHRKGDRVEPVDGSAASKKGEMRTEGKTENALEVPQGAAAHPAGTPDGLTARHGTRSF